jgi:1-deoxy-D-xylulose-5-phosphate reductoisomerase
MTQRITLLGSTGSIGKSTLDVVARHPERYSIYALSAQRNWEALAEQCAVFRPEVAVIGTADAVAPLRDALRRHGLATEVAHGPDALCDIASAPACDTVVAAIVGAAGLPSALAAARTGKRILLANKEALVMSGALFMATVQQSGATLLPLDSEHNAIFQCLPPAQQTGAVPVQDPRGGIEKIVLTASGGPFRTRDPASLADVTPDQACAHPNWVMGRKISVDSATMMNKGLEVIEAHWLFGLPPSRIDVLIHPQSVIHSMVTYSDGSVLAELGNPDMRTPIAYALSYPERITSGVGPLDLAAIGQLQFEKPDLVRFPCLRLAFESLEQGGTASAAMNAANEVAVDAFLAGQIRFTAIASVVEAVMNAMTHGAATRLEDVFAADDAARSAARACLERHQWHQ